jgi:long-subunit acyl-CoA synthetase (AMP-forming)
MPNLVLGYGMTETSCVCHLTPIENGLIGSIGEPLSRTKVKVVDVDTGLSLGPGQHGEVCIKGPQVMKGYYKNEKATKETIDSDGWLHTGDMVYYDEQNQFFIVDRLKELIKVKGLQVLSPYITCDFVKQVNNGLKILGSPIGIGRYFTTYSWYFGRCNYRCPR